MTPRPPVLKFDLRDDQNQIVESRRIMAPEEETFEALRAAVERVFKVEPGTYDVIWTDEDGDTIVVRSDEEVSAARVAHGTTRFGVVEHVPVAPGKPTLGEDFERRRFADKQIVDSVLVCDDGTKIKGRWVSENRFAAMHVPESATHAPGETFVAAGTFIAEFDADGITSSPRLDTGAKTAFVPLSIGGDEDDLEAFEDWQRREPWTWSDDRKKKYARPLRRSRELGLPHLDPGTWVELVNLKTERFNGARAYVAAERPDGRVVVHLLPPHDATLAVKRDNLRTVFDADDGVAELESSLRALLGGEEDVSDVMGRSKTCPLCIDGVVVAFFQP